MSDNRQQWELIKQEAPVLADFLTSITQVMGKPQAVSITLASGVVVESGEIDSPKVIFKTTTRFMNGR